MGQVINIVHEDPKGYQSIAIGERTLDFIDRLTIDDDAKDTLIDEAINILTHCISPGVEDNITNIAVGYVQSGKTMSFTTLTTLAADNGYRVVIYLTGTKNNLQDQTFSRLAKDLNTQENIEYYRLFKDSKIITQTEYKRVPFILKSTDTVLLFPILKHYQHINNLASLFSDAKVVDALGFKGVLIIDDEADQSSFNTYAKANAANADDWDYEDQFSKTYASILNLRKALPCHSYVQYTATPQAAFLINNADILSPKYHTVLTPGKEYTGGKFFFKNEENMELIITIPEDEVHHNTRNPLTKLPESLKSSLYQFIISVAIAVFIQKRISFLTMMVHPDGLKSTNEQFHAWIKGELNFLIDVLQSPVNDPAYKAYTKRLKKEFDSITKYVENKPSFDNVIKVLPNAIIMTDIHLVQGNIVSGYEEEATNNVDWDTAQGHILVGADMLNRGFTVEHLSMTYMFRTTKGKSNADTIEQRCRFFGYKRKYIDLCRVYLPKKSIQEYQDYVEHEEILRTNLKACNSLADFTSQAKAMILAGTLNPTRTNILSNKLIRNKMFGWRQMTSIDCIEKNKALVENFILTNESKFSPMEDFHNDMRNHRIMKISIDEFAKFFSNFKLLDVPNITRKVVTIQYLYYLQEVKGLNYVYVVQMAYNAEPRKRRLKDNKPQQLFMGYDRSGSYPGDKEMKMDDSLTIQIHHLIADDISVKYGNKDFYNLAIHYPENEEYIAFDSDNDDD